MGRAEALPIFYYITSSQRQVSVLSVQTNRISALTNLLMIDCFGHAETGVLTDIHLVEHLFGTFVGEHQAS